MTPSQKYAALVAESGLVADPQQQHCVALLDDLHQRILDSGVPNRWRRMLGKAGRWNPVKGLYFWGGVGRGKTLLMDIFYQCLPPQIKRERIHFHSFMNHVHSELAKLRDD